MAGDDAGVDLFTIGHSTRTAGEFIALLEENRISRLVDVRRLPGSTKFPQFNQDALRRSLEEHGVAMSRFEALTGRRPVSKTVPFEVNSWWENRSFHNYADHALSPEFAEAIVELEELGKDDRVAIMCSEAVWWRCHRRLIADYLLARDTPVIHILGPHNLAPAVLSAGAEPQEDGTIIYPPKTEKNE